MNIPQANHTLQKSTPAEPQSITSGIKDSEVFLEQLNLAQQETEWYLETNDQTEKERTNKEQQAKRREAEDIGDEQIAGMTSQAYFEQLKQSDLTDIQRQSDLINTQTKNSDVLNTKTKQSDALESARIISNSENQERTMRYVDSKHLNAQAATEDGENSSVNTKFNEIAAGEIEALKKGNLVKEPVNAFVHQETDEVKPDGQRSPMKTGEAANGDALRRFDAGLMQRVNASISGKSGARLVDKGLSEMSKITAADMTIGKSADKKATAKTISFSNLANEGSDGNRRAETGVKVESSPAKAAAPVNIKDIAGTVKIMISSKTNEMVLKLAPEHLGKLEIRLKKEGDKLTGRFKVESLEAKNAIHSQIHLLKEGLAEQGVQIETFTIIVNGEDDPGGSFAFNQGNKHEAGQSGDSGTSRNESRSEIQSSENTAASFQKDPSGLNIYI